MNSHFDEKKLFPIVHFVQIFKQIDSSEKKIESAKNKNQQDDDDKFSGQTHLSKKNFLGNQIESNIHNNNVQCDVSSVKNTDNLTNRNI